VVGAGVLYPARRRGCAVVVVVVWCGCPKECSRCRVPQVCLSQIRTEWNLSLERREGRQDCWKRQAGVAGRKVERVAKAGEKRCGAAPR